MEFMRKRESTVTWLLPGRAIERIMVYGRWSAGWILIRLRGNLNSGQLKTKTHDRKF